MMSMEYTYWKDKDFYIGYLNDFPDYKTQAYSVSELEENLKSLYDDIKSDEIPFIRHVGKLEMAQYSEINEYLAKSILKKLKNDDFSEL